MKIKGKEYTEVSERVKQFRDGFKDYRLVTSIAHMEQDRVIFKAEVYNDKDRLVSTGYAEELKGNAVDDNGKANINYDNYVEIAETSAVGRALGFLGIGITSGIASADEVSNAVEKQESRTTNSNEKKYNTDPIPNSDPNDTRPLINSKDESGDWIVRRRKEEDVRYWKNLKTGETQHIG